MMEQVGLAPLPCYLAVQDRMLRDICPGAEFVCESKDKVVSFFDVEQRHIRETRAHINIDRIRCLRGNTHLTSDAAAISTAIEQGKNVVAKLARQTASLAGDRTNRTLSLIFKEWGAGGEEPQRGG